MPNRTFLVPFGRFAWSGHGSCLGDTQLGKNTRAKIKTKRVQYLHTRTFLVRFGRMSGEFGRAMARILARRSPYAAVRRKRTKKVRLDVYRTPIRPSKHGISAIAGQ